MQSSTPHICTLYYCTKYTENLRLIKKKHKRQLLSFWAMQDIVLLPTEVHGKLSIKSNCTGLYFCL